MVLFLSDSISPFLSPSFPPFSLSLVSKLKKLIRAWKGKGISLEEREEQRARPPQQWNLDYTLVPFEGLTPEYMEMSEYIVTVGNRGEEVR